MNKGLAFVYFFLFSTALAVGQNADFSYSSITGTYCNPDTIRFTQNATGSPVGYIWDFGNNRKSHSANPSIIYANPGTYNVRLIVVYSQGTAEVTKTIVINSTVDSTFTMDKMDLCQPGTINFTASGVANGTIYTWNFGDGTPDVSSNSPSLSHDFTKFGNFIVTLTVNSAGNCISTSSQQVSVRKPQIDGTVSSIDGCIPAGINFNSNVILLPGDAISSYTWDYGDGISGVTASGASSHIYNVAGNYIPRVSVTTTAGCSNTFTFDSLAFGTPPTNLNAYTNKNVICGSERAFFVGKATNANEYSWDNGETIDNVIDTFSRHKYSSLGTKWVVVTPLFNGCEGIPDSFKITVVGVISKFSFANSCSDKKTFSFRNRSLGNITSVIWDFADGSPRESTFNVTHTFPNVGNFKVALIVSDSISGCSDTLYQPIHTTNPLFINSDQYLCRNGSTLFSVLNEYSTDATIYRYFVLGDKHGIFDDSLQAKPRLFGTFNNYVLILNGPSYCPDSIQLDHQITVKGPVVDFTSNDSICLSNLLAVTNNSKPFIPGETIVSWDWNFGDGSVHDSTAQPAPHEYTYPGIFTVSLRATDINGCTDVFSKKVHVSDDAFVYLLPRTDTLCSGQSTTLIAYHNDSIMWSPANFVSCATCDTVLANPTQTTQFIVTSSNSFGCTAIDSMLVKVYPPFTATTPVTDLYMCLNDSVTLDAGPANYKIIWSPPSGLSNPNVYSPVASPMSTTTYTATLSDSVGCFTSSVDVAVHLNTQPTVDAGQDQFYPFNSPFTISPTYSSNIVSYLWSPSNQLSCTTCTSPSGTVLKKESYTIAVTSDSGCVAKDEITIYVECKDANLLLPNAFTPNGDNINDVFYPLARGVEKILNFSIFSREGKLMYQKKDFPPNDKTYGWNGNISGTTPSTAVYVYIMEALCDSGEKLSKKGSFVLIR